jgi:ribosomal protein S18 acetylase RimI-like enzyme
MQWLNKPVAVKEPPAGAVPAKDPKDTVISAENTPPRNARIAETTGTTETTGIREDNQNDAPTNGSTSFLKGSKPSLPPNVELRGPTKEDMPSFKKLNSLLLPIPYPENFYKEILADPVDRSITLMALWHDSPSDVGKVKGRLVGAIRCRLFAHPPGDSASKARIDGPMLYLSTLVLLSPYRGYGIAAHMLDNLIRSAVDDYNVTSVGAHVWEANEEGLEWYRKRGFKVVSREPGYYRRLSPSDAVVMLRDVGVMDLAGKGVVRNLGVACRAAGFPGDTADAC